MLTDKSKKVIQGEMSNLPKDVQDAVSASNWEKISEEIGKKYLLDEDEIETFQLETASLLLGATDEDEYQENIENEVGTSGDEAKKIAGEVFEKILTPIDNTLTEKIKKNVMGKNTDWQQNIDFILSGGDYSSFIAPIRVIESEKDDKKKVPMTGGRPTARVVPVISVSPLSATPTLADIKANTEKTNIPIKPKETNDSQKTPLKFSEE